MTEGRVDIDHAVLGRFLGWGGPVGQDLDRRLRTLQFRGRQSAARVAMSRSAKPMRFASRRSVGS